MNLSDMMTRWGQLWQEMDALERGIKAEVLALQQTQKVGPVTVTYDSGRGKYDYVAMAGELRPSTDIVAMYSHTEVDWRKVCDAVGASEELRQKHYTPGTPSVTIKFKV